VFIVGITGGIGSGKSAVTDILAQQGIGIVDADIVAREVVEPGSAALKSIAQHFDTDLIQADGSLDRARLREIVFKAPQERQWLESLLHPIIRESVQQQLSASNSSYTVLSSPLLLETDQHTLTDYIVVVDVPEAIQIQRTMQRDANNLEQVKAIIAAQISRETRNSRADMLISNDGDLSALHNKVLALHQQLLIQAEEEKND